MTTCRLGIIVLLCSVLAGQAGATVQEQLEAAADNQSVAFTLVMEPGVAGLDAARDVIREAMKEVESSTLIELDRSSAANAPLVARYRLAASPVPLILLVAPNGAIAGGMPGATATPEALVKLVPSPRKAEVLQAIQSGKAVFIVASRKGMGTQSEVSSTCAMACQKLDDKAVTVEIDLDDKAEAPFLAQLGIDANSPNPVTKVINPQGQITGTFVGSVEIAGLVENATKRVSSGCCPSGSGKSCGPTKK